MGFLRTLLDRLRGVRPPIVSVDDPVLGRLTRGGDRWDGELRNGDRVIELSVFGTRDAPSPEALEMLKRMALPWGAFEQRVARHLSDEAERPMWRDFAREIVAQRISALSMGRKRHPAEGWVFLEDSRPAEELSEDEYSDRAWRCWHSNGQFSRLGFDS